MTDLFGERFQEAFNPTQDDQEWGGVDEEAPDRSEWGRVWIDRPTGILWLPIDEAEHPRTGGEPEPEEWTERARVQSIHGWVQEEHETSLPWRWAHEITATVPEEPEWVYERMFGPRDKIMFAGQPKAGKSTWVFGFIEAVAGDGEPSFLGRQVGNGPVVVVSEEGDQTLAAKLRGMLPERVRVLNRDAIHPKPTWEELVAEATREAQRVGAVMLVVDSVSFWAQFEGASENESGTAQAAMDALDGAARSGLLVFLVHHQRREGGGPRGSGAFMGAVDTVIEYERLGEDSPSRQRRLVIDSRWPQAPDVLVVEYNHEGDWRLVGEADSRHGSEVLGVREEILGVAPSTKPGASEDELCEMLGKDKRKVGGPLRKLVDDQELKREGRGVSGDPYRYWRPPL